MEGSDKESYVTVGALLATPGSPSQERHTHRGKSTDKVAATRITSHRFPSHFSLRGQGTRGSEREEEGEGRGGEGKKLAKEAVGIPSPSVPPSLSSSIRSVIDEFFDPRSRFSPDREDENLNEPLLLQIHIFRPRDLNIFLLPSFVLPRRRRGR